MFDLSEATDINSSSGGMFICSLIHYVLRISTAVTILVMVIICPAEPGLFKGQIFPLCPGKFNFVVCFPSSGFEQSSGEHCLSVEWVNLLRVILVWTMVDCSKVAESWLQKEQISKRLQPGWKSAVKITFSPKTFEVPEKGSFPNGIIIEDMLLYMRSRLSYLHTAVWCCRMWSGQQVRMMEKNWPWNWFCWEVISALCKKFLCWK